MSLVRARRGFVVFNRDGGMPRRIKQGAILESTDPAYVANQGQFEKLDDLVTAFPVERATAGPGEKRSVDVKTGIESAEKFGTPTVKKAEEKPARRTPVKVDTTDLPKGKQDGEV